MRSPRLSEELGDELRTTVRRFEEWEVADPREVFEARSGDLAGNRPAHLGGSHIVFAPDDECRRLDPWQLVAEVHLRAADAREQRGPRALFRWETETGDTCLEVA